VVPAAMSGRHCRNLGLNLFFVKNFSFEEWFAKIA
jgi:hypothetical protein